MKAQDLARDLGISHKELVNFLLQRRLTRNPSAPLSPKAVEAVRNEFSRGNGSGAGKAGTGEAKKIGLPPNLTVKDFAERINVSTVEVIKKLIANGVMAAQNHVIDYGTAEIIADEFGIEVEPLSLEDLIAVDLDGTGGNVVTTSRNELFAMVADDPTKLRPRPPVVTVLGHVDHGKTSILDAIRNTRVAAGEAGGITQRIGAYKISTKDGHEVVFIDTPGHEAFTAMRARGAQVTDVAVLVVAADDGVMPQTREAIQHARAAAVPIVVAINKMDKEGANPDRVHQELAQENIITRHYGGEYECVHVSARTGMGLDDLLTTVVLTAEIREPKANPDRLAIGTIVDAQMERGRGPVATVLVQHGTLRVGDNFVCGHIYGRVRSMSDDRGRPISEAGPSTPVLVSGWSELPNAGDILQIVESEKTARGLALAKLQERRSMEAARDTAPRLTLDELARRAKEGEVKELNLVVKADAQGTLEAVVNALQKIEDPVVAIRIVGQGAGNVNDSDVLLASVSNAIIVCFNLKPNPASDRAAEREKVEIRYYDVIYKLTEDVERAAKGMREPTYRRVEEGRVEVVMPIKVPKVGIIAGSRVVEGKVSRDGVVRLLRNNKQIYEGRIVSLKHYKDDVKEMSAGQECGIGLDGFTEFEPGDVMITYRMEREEI